mgnify:CR=1 FL=1
MHRILNLCLNKLGIEYRSVSVLRKIVSVVPLVTADSNKEPAYDTIELVRFIHTVGYITSGVNISPGSRPTAFVL